MGLMAHIVRTSLLGYTTSEADGRRRTAICVGCVRSGQVIVYLSEKYPLGFKLMFTPIFGLKECL